VGILLVWFVLGYFFYSTLFAAAAARITRQEDLQNVTTPASTLVLVSFFAAIWAGNNPDAPLARALSVLPPFSALVNPVRMAVGDAPVWELALAAALMVAASAGLVLVGARLYEGAVLRTGGKVRLADAWRRDRAGV
jgi:ABC-2 type transport system permease protein